MVPTRSTATPELPYDIAVEIAGLVAASSPWPMDDISSLRASCKAMHAACRESAVGRRVALEREARMKWSDAERYRAVVERLASAGNPEACFLVGLTLVFADRRAAPGAQCLARAAAAGHKAAAYVLGLLRYDADRGARDAAEYIRQVEGEVDVDEDAAAHVAKKKRTNTGCERYRAQALEAVREVTWKVPTVLTSPAPDKEGHRCTAAGCGAPLEWSNVLVFCSDGCRIRHEHVLFFSLVSLPASIP